MTVTESSISSPVSDRSVLLCVIGFLGGRAPFLRDGQVTGQHVPSSVTAFLEVLGRIGLCLLDRVREAAFFGGCAGPGLQKAIG